MKRIGAVAEYTGTIPAHSSINLNEVSDLINQTRRNRVVVLEGALTIENKISQIISHYLFGQAHERKEVFESILLDSESCSFATKRRLVRYIINEQCLLTGSEKTEFDKLIRNIMSWRNAFIHGKLSCPDGKSVWLSFFEGGPQKKELTDEFLTEVESFLRVGYEACFKMILKMGITKMSEAGTTPKDER